MNELRIFVAGHGGLGGSAVCRGLRQLGIEPLTLTRAELDLRDEHKVYKTWHDLTVSHVINCAGHAGGVMYNIHNSLKILEDNLMTQQAMMSAAARLHPARFIHLGSSCMYPSGVTQPMTEEMLMTGEPHPSVRSYAISKLVGLEMCRLRNFTM